MLVPLASGSPAEVHVGAGGASHHCDHNPNFVIVFVDDLGYNEINLE